MQYPVHGLTIFIAVFCGVALGILLLAYFLGKKAGEQARYIHGYKEGQQSTNTRA